MLYCGLHLTLGSLHCLPAILLFFFFFFFFFFFLRGSGVCDGSVPSNVNCEPVHLVSYRNHGPWGFPGWGRDNEEIAAQESDPAVRGVHHGGANIDHHRTYEEWQLTAVPAGFVLLIFSTYFALESIYDTDIVSAFRALYTVGMAWHIIFFSLQGQANLAELMTFISSVCLWKCMGTALP